MRVFICPYGGFNIAIPAGTISSVSLFKNRQEKTIEYNNDDITVTNNRFILLTTTTEKETDINNEEIYPVPKTLLVFRFSALFSGIKINSKAKEMILLLNTRQLVDIIQNWRNKND
jgi:hypothetical protein